MTIATLLFRLAALLLLLPVSASATPIRHVRTEVGVDWVSSGLGGVGGGSGTLTLAGVNGPVRKAFLYWHGIDRACDGGNGVYDNPSITFNGTAVQGTALGDATTNCWILPNNPPPCNAGAGSSRAFRADVSHLVTGNGAYAVAGLSGQAGHNANGVSLVVTFNDGVAGNDRDLVFFEGNDSSHPEGFAGEDDGWHGTLAGIRYQGGAARAQLHVADGQGFGDSPVTFASAAGTVTLPDSATLWDGNSVASAGSSRAGNGALWDVHTFDLAGAFGAPGTYTLQVDGQVPPGNDCLGLVVLLLDLEAGAAPPTPTATPTPPATGECKQYFAQDLPQHIPDNGSATSTLSVPDAGVIADVNVIFLIGTHTAVGDLEFRLRSPAGTEVAIIDRVCGSSENFDLDLDDEAATGIPCPPTDESAHRPSNPLAAFDGQAATGTWTLQVFDRAGADAGTLEDWGLEICRGGAPATPTPTRTPTRPAASCCAAHDAPGCEATTCQNCVCAVVPSCCEESWDEFCTMVATNECALSCPCVTATPTRTRTVTPTPSATVTRTYTRTPTPSPSPTRTFTPTFTFTRTPTPTATRTPTPTFTTTATRTPTSGVDLIAEHLEVSQAIQDLENSVRLVARKRTYVRFHVRASAGTHLTTARLTAQRGGDVVTLAPINPRGQILVRPAPNRGVRDHSFLFALPSGFRSGSVQLTAEVNPLDAPPEGNRANNTATARVRFEIVPSQSLVLYKVGYSSGGTVIYPSDVHRAQMAVWMRRAFPISDLRVLLRSYFFGRAVASAGTLLEPSCTQVNAFLSSKRLFDLASSEEVPRTGRYYGMVQDTAGFMRGCAAGIPAFVSSGPNGAPAAGDWDTDGSYGDWYGGHEVAHTLGRPHAEFCGAQAGGPFPYPGGRISPVLSGPTAIYGFDIVTRDVYGPDWKDVMSYCPLQWVSDFTYEGLMDFYQAGAALQATVAGVVADRLVIVGTIDPVSGAVALQPIFTVPNAGELKPRVPGPYAIVLRDGGGAELARYPFTPDVIHEGPPADDGTGREVEVLFIHELVPLVAGTARIDIEGPSGLLTSVSAGAGAPNVQLTAPNGGEVLDQPTVRVSWSSSDPDEDLLSFSLQYSRDDGATWEMVAQYLVGSSVELDAGNIGRTDQGRFRVLVSDGINTASDDSDGPFTVPNRVPSAAIVEPSGPVTIAVGQTLTLEGDAYDVDTGTLPDERLEWLSSRDGLLGTGPSLDVATLSVGEHLITFRADDGEGGVASAEVAVRVVADLSELPPVADALSVGPLLLSLTATAPAVLAIDNESPLAILEWQALAGEPWLRLSAASGTTPAEVLVSLDPTGLAPGRYGAVLTITSAAGARQVTVEAQVGIACTGDCDGNGEVTVSELITGVNLALGNPVAAECAAFDTDADGAVSISELVSAVNAALAGCR